MNTTGVQPHYNGIAFATPADWLTIKVPRSSVDVAQLARAVAAAQPELGSRPAVERLLNGLIEICAELDVLGAWVNLLEVPGGLLPATLVASAHPVTGQTLDEIAQDMAGVSDAAAPPEVRLFDLPAGRMARIERLQESPREGRERLVSLVVQYLAEIPGTGGAMVLTFSTPALALSDQLRQVFHQIACTLRFEDQ